VTCFVCGRGELAPVPFVRDLYECAMCGVRSTRTRPASTFDDAYYERHYRTTERSPAYDLVVARVARSVPPGARVLDMGCGAGRLVVALRDAGFDAIGVDPSEAARRAATKSDVDAYASTADVKAGSPFAAVCIIDVVAHVPDVRALAVGAISVLAPGGVLVVRTPASTRGLARIEQAVTVGGRVGGSPLLHRSSRMHHFDTAALRHALESWGCHDVVVERVDEPVVRDAAHPLTGVVAQRVQRAVTGGGSLLATGVRS